MTARIYHWTGENPNIHTSSANSVVFVETGYSGNERIEIATDIQRFGSSSFHVGYVDAADNSVNPPTYYRRRTYLNASGTIDTVGQGDFALAFWWKPTSESFYSEGGNHKTIISSHLGLMSSYALHGHSLTNYDIRWYAPYGDDTPDVDQYIAKTYQINLTGLPWIHIYASRIGETLRFVLTDINGDVFVDNSGNDCEWSYTGQASKRYNINNVTNQTPFFRVGGGGSGTSNIGYYDDIVLVQSQSLSYDSLDLTRPVYISGEPITPVINSFSSSATTVESGDSVTLSWEDYYSESLQLQKHIGGVLNSTETVTGSSKSVTVTESVTYKIRGANTYASSSFSSVEITSNGGNSMAYAHPSGAFAIPYQLHGGFLGGFVTGSNGEFDHLAMSGVMGADAAHVTAGHALVSGFAGATGSLVAALNAAYNVGSFDVGQGIDAATFSGADTLRLSASANVFTFGSQSNGYRLELHQDVAGDGLGMAAPNGVNGGGALSVNVDDTGIEINSDALRLKDGGVTTAKLDADAVTEAKLADGAVVGDNIQALAVSSSHIVANAITNSELATLAVSASNIVASAVETAKINDLAVTTAKLAADAVTEIKLADNAVVGDNIQALAVSSSHIVANAITNSELAPLAVSASNIVADAVITAKINDGAVTTAKINDEAVTNAKLAGLAVDTGQIAADAVTEAKLADNAVVGDNIQALAISSSHIIANAVTNSELATLAVSASNIVASAVTTAKIAADAVTEAKLADGAVVGDNIQALAISSSHIVANAVTNSELATLSVSASNIVASAVTTAKINDDAVTSAKLGSAAVDIEALGTGSVDTAALIDLNVTTAKLAADAVTAPKIADLAISASHIVAGAVTDAKLNADVFSSAHTFSGVQQFGLDKLRVSGSTAAGANAYFSFKVEGGILVLTAHAE